VVARDAHLFPPDGLPDTIDALLAGARVVIIGETHYQEEHQRFLVRLLPKLHAAGVRTFLQEEMHAVGWAVDDYVRLRSDLLPTEPAALLRITLDGLRAFNAALAEADRIRFVSVDATHQPGLLQEMLVLFQGRFGQVAALADLLAAPADSAAYQTALAALPATLAAQAADLQLALGSERHAQLLELVAVEPRSRAWRLGHDGNVREALILERVTAAIGAAGGAPVVLNIGQWHSQRVRQLTPMLQPVTARLLADPSSYGGDPAALRTIGCTAAQGQALWSGSNVPFAFDVRSQADNDLTRILAEQAGAQAAWLPLGDPVFSGAPLSFTTNTAVALVQPGRLWDALVLYPTATVLASLAPSR
jgi:hypothetical protein